MKLLLSLLALSAATAKDIRIGIIGLDTSHGVAEVRKGTEKR